MLTSSINDKVLCKMIILFVVMRDYVQCSRIGLDLMSLTPHLERKKRTTEMVCMYS